MLDERLLRSLTQLIAWPTESGTPNRALIDWVADQLETFGARIVVIDGPDGRANLLATWGPEGDGGLMLSGHTDVVPAGTGWSTDPYFATVTADRVLGRGTADMKGFIACAMTVIEDLDTALLTRPLHLALSYDEEVGCIGVRSMLTRLTSTANGVRPDVVVIGEPTMMRPRHAHLGKAAFRLVFTAASAHSSLSPSQPNAITSAARVITSIDAACPRDGAEPGVTTNVGIIAGGSALNVLADRCELSFEVRHSAAFDADELLVPIWAAVDRERSMLAAVDGGVDVIDITRYPALDTDVDQQVVRLVERLADRGPLSNIGYGTEGGLFAEALGVPVVICGPGDIADAHRPDEFVSDEQLVACLGFLRRAVDSFCRIGSTAS